ENKPGVSNLLSILAAARGTDPVDEADGYSQYGPLKADAAEAIIELLRPVRKRYEELDDVTVAELLAVGEAKAQEKATEVMDRVRSAVELF
ncbi:MAG: tryptophan--tRNA ligase, partial [Acidimicrobiia bacterium]|nr:tryptophan--tRNA ligase [Acidimicrobiia bacterium]